MRRILHPTFFVFKKTAGEWFEEGILRLGASLSFYALFSIPPLFVIVLAISGFWFGDEAARRELFGQVSGAVGHQGSDAIQSLVRVAHTENRSPWATMLALSILLITATGTFVELQSSLNTIWGVRRKPGRGIRNVVNAKFTQVYSDINHLHVEPIPGAEAVTVEKVVSPHRPPA